MIDDRAVAEGGAGVLAEADHRHLEEPALDLAREVRVRLHAVHDRDVIGLVGGAVEVERDAVVGGAQHAPALPVRASALTGRHDRTDSAHALRGGFEMKDDAVLPGRLRRVEGTVGVLE